MLADLLAWLGWDQGFATTLFFLVALMLAAFVCTVHSLLSFGTENDEFRKPVRIRSGRNRNHR